MNISSPTSSLPPLIHLTDTSGTTVSNALQNLINLYWPAPNFIDVLPKKLTLPVRHLHANIHHISVPDSGYASADEDEDEDEYRGSLCVTTPDQDLLEQHELIRADPLERKFVLKWLTGVLSRADVWISESDSLEERELRSSLIEQAGTIFADFVKGEQEESEECAVIRTFNFGLASVELNDAPLAANDHTSVGLQSWGSSIILARRFCASPERFSFDSQNPIRVLELGAGTGMLSIVAAKLMPLATVVATDYHPHVLSNLSANIETNGVGVQVTSLDWEAPDLHDKFLYKPFDIILAADVIYHQHHARWIKDCVAKLLRKTDTSVFWLIVPVRTTGRNEGMDLTAEAVFSEYSRGQERQLEVVDQERLFREEGVGRTDECGYKLFKICWIS